MWSAMCGAASGFVVGSSAGAGAGAAICTLGYEGGATSGEGMTYTVQDVAGIGALGGAAGGGLVGATTGGVVAMALDDVNTPFM